MCDCCETMAEAVDVLRAELEAEREARQELEERVAELEAQESPVEIRTPQDRESSLLGDVWIDGHPVGQTIERNKQARDELEKEAAVDVDQDADEIEPAAELDETAPPIYDVLRTPTSRLEPTERRTQFLWRDLADYATRTPAGYVLAASDARRVLQAAEPEESDCDRIDATLVGRVFDLSVVLTREAAFVRTDGGERQLVVPTDWDERARAAAGDTAVS